jgi:hypothetical protein
MKERDVFVMENINSGKCYYKYAEFYRMGNLNLFCPCYKTLRKHTNQKNWLSGDKVIIHWRNIVLKEKNSWYLC